MRFERYKRLRRSVAAGATLICLAALGAALLSTVKIERDGVAIRAGKFTGTKTLATPPKGADLNVLAEDGKWLKVEFNGQQGWVHRDYIGPLRTSAKGNGVIDALTGDAEARETSVAAAGKGVGATARNYAQSRGKSLDGLETMIASRERVVESGAWQKFASEGNVGSEAKK